MRIASPGRVAVIAGLAVAVAMTSGCSWFRKDNEAYKLSGEARPLELPPQMNQPDTRSAMQLPGSGGVLASQASATAPSPQAGAGFNVAGERDAVFARVGQALAAAEGVTIASSAQLLGTHDVTYQGANFLIRTTQAGDNVYVSAIDPRGIPDTGAAAVALLGQLKAALGGR